MDTKTMVNLAAGIAIGYGISYFLKVSKVAGVGKQYECFCNNGTICKSAGNDCSCCGGAAINPRYRSDRFNPARLNPTDLNPNKFKIDQLTRTASY